MEFPKPPTSNRNTQAPPPPQRDSRLDDDEMAMLLDKYLTPSHRADPQVLAFIMRYLDTRNAAQSGRDVGIASGQGSYLRSRPDIHACIQAISDKAVMKYGYDAAEIIERVKEVVDIDPIEFENPDGSFKTNMSQIRPEARRAIKKFKAKNLYGEDRNGMQIVIGQIIEVELYDKLKGAEMLGPEKEIFKKTTKVEHDVTQNMASVLLESKRIADERAQMMRVEREALPAPVEREE